jgi:ribonuclease E
MTRQRIRPSLKKSVYFDCPCCGGRGVVKSEESMALEVIRMLMLASQQPKCRVAIVRVNEKVASYLNNQKRKAIGELENNAEFRIEIRGSENVYPEHLVIECRDEFGNEIRMPISPGK